MSRWQLQEVQVETIYTHCAGLDVHKKTVVACRMITTPDGASTRETRTFGTVTRDLLQLLDWLQQVHCTHAAMESTGEYWRPVYNILEGSFQLLLVNSQHVKNVPGRKTDVKDAEWLADLLRHGLLRSSFVPPRAQRDLRSLVRERSNLTRERADMVNRLQKILEDANIKLSSVVSDVSGVSARDMLQALMAGEQDLTLIADMARGAMRKKREQLELALAGRMRPHHSFLVAHHLGCIDFMDEQIERFDVRIEQQMEQMDQTPPAQPTPGGPPHAEADGDAVEWLSCQQACALIDTIPGFGLQLAQVMVAEIGTDMSRFPSAGHLASWAGLSPGNNESGGKRRSGRIRPANHYLRPALVQAAHAASHQADTYLSAQYHRLAARRGKRRAIIAVAHSLVVIIYHVLTRREPYRELGSNYFDERKRDLVTNRLVHRLERLGYDVSLQPKSLVCPAVA